MGSPAAHCGGAKPQRGVPSAASCAQSLLQRTGNGRLSRPACLLGGNRSKHRAGPTTPSSAPSATLSPRRPRDPWAGGRGRVPRRRQRVLTRGRGGPVAVRWGGLVDRERPGQPQAKTCQQEWAEGLHGEPGRGRTGSGDAPSPQVGAHRVADMGRQLLGPSECGRGVPAPCRAQPASERCALGATRPETPGSAPGSTSPSPSG